MEVNIIGVGQIAITVQDIERARNFYQNQLGLTYLFSAGNLVFFKSGDLRILLTTPETQKNEVSNSVIYFNVADINMSYSNLLERQVVFIDKPHLIAKMGNVETWMTFFNDSEGNLLALMSEF
ncbi:MAG: glyoxalase [Tenericutes bacterium HGW-Tenericutes-2]|jgi:predicted enzyme related to lactoylglutathione lyase|nr:MAG: glyoxalase [Tenericutes bacterium HGW-Tenericutes-2]